MEIINAEFVERYQIMLQNDPKSKVFAPLAEAYRKLKMYNEAIDICKKGLQHNPHFSSGYIALARVYLDLNKIDLALNYLKMACENSNENLLAHELLAECYLKLKQTKEALKAYKMVLFLNPQHTRAQNAIKKLESLTADEYEEDLFSMEKLSSSAKFVNPNLELEVENHSEKTLSPKDEYVDRYISLIDAFLARNEPQKAVKALLEAEKNLGPHPEILKRRGYLKKHPSSSQPSPSKPEAEKLSPLPEFSTKATSSSTKIDALKKLLRAFESVSPNLDNK